MVMGCLKTLKGFLAAVTKAPKVADVPRESASSACGTAREYP